MTCLPLSPENSSTTTLSSSYVQRQFVHPRLTRPRGGGAVLCRFAGKAGIIVLSLIEMKAFRQILRVTWTVKRTKDWVLSKAGTEPFLLQSVKKRELSLLWSCATERRKLHGERNNARYYFWSKKKRKTKNTLAG